ncbi:MAG: PepSY domain-containing protein [Anaerolineales bacterium]|nr:PepSY domain-containing protein [Anaerolineales bacterium]
MKINRFIALAAIALLIVGGMGAIATRSFAQSATPPAQVQGNDATEAVETGPDTDTVEDQFGEQVEDGLPDAAEAPGTPDDGAQTPSYTGSVSVDQAQTEGMSEADEVAALQGKATLSAADAEAAALAANPGATVVKSELDNENGVLVYSVELSNGADVKVDAGNGAILFTDTDADSEG